MWQAWAVHRFRREDSLRRLAAEEFDVLVIGGGITGAGVALDPPAGVSRRPWSRSRTSPRAPPRSHPKWSTAACATSSNVNSDWSTRIWPSVSACWTTRPHLVSPLPFLIPLFGRDGVVSKAVARSYATALWLYDLTGGLRIGARHKRVNKEETLAHLPTLRTEHLVAGFLYYDARADDARLTLTWPAPPPSNTARWSANYTDVAG